MKQFHVSLEPLSHGVEDEDTNNTWISDLALKG